MSNWNNLSLTERAEIIKAAVRQGLNKLPDIVDAYNTFAEGGYLTSPSEEMDEITVEYVDDSNVYKEGGSTKNQETKTITENNNAKIAMAYFIGKGLAPHQAAGLVGNLMRESNLNTKATNSSSGAYGIAQWLGSRKKALFAEYGKQPSLKDQLDFVWKELNSSHKAGLRALLASENAEDAARNAMGYYEFSAGPEGAIAEMHKYGQNGTKSMQQGINNALKLMGTPEVYTQKPMYYNPQLYDNSGIPQESPFKPITSYDLQQEALGNIENNSLLAEPQDTLKTSFMEDVKKENNLINRYAQIESENAALRNAIFGSAESPIVEMRSSTIDPYSGLLNNTYYNTLMAGNNISQEPVLPYFDI